MYASDPKERRDSKEGNVLKSDGKMKCWMEDLEGKMDVLHVKVKNMQDHPVPLSPSGRAVRSIRAMNAAPSPTGREGAGGGIGIGAEAVRVTQSEKSSDLLGDVSLGM
jgi:hypothetical protein